MRALAGFSHAVEMAALLKPEIPRCHPCRDQCLLLVALLGLRGTGPGRQHCKTMSMTALAMFEASQTYF